MESAQDYKTVPLKILVDKREFVDEKGLNIEELVESMEKSDTSSTSCPNTQEWLDAFEGADTIFAITISSQLSGSYNSAILAKNQFLEAHPDAKIEIIDSIATGGSMTLIAEKIVQCMEEGLSFEETLQTVYSYMNHTHIIFLLESLQNLAKNGRLNPTIAKIAGLLGIRFLGKGSEKGTIQQAAIAKGPKRAMSAMYNEIKKLGYVGGKMRISNCLNLETATQLKELLLKEFPLSDIQINACGGLCSYYAERGGLIICFEDFK
ncbi:MAG: DegV family EDD domain-containing protein [Solobacterium sp.]|nr:DegV family EDD domain-containing protein [Solobacterium sp.]